MTPWTQAAEEAFEAYARTAREHAAAMGADPDELVLDLRNHVEEEAARKGATALTAADVTSMHGRARAGRARSSGESA